MLKPRPLQPGDRVALVAPASPSSIEDVEAGCAELRRLGFEPVEAPEASTRALFVAGTAAERASAFMSAWRDPSVAALVAVRGGYGSAHLLPLLDLDRLRQTPKLFCGYSDTTALVSWLTCHVGVTALHGPMVDRRLSSGQVAYDVGSFLHMTTRTDSWRVEWGAGEVVRAGEARGPLYGGTLTPLAASLGTPFAFDPPEGAVLFLEDVNERPYRVHRLLTQLAQSGILAKASGVVFGEMVGCDEPGGHPRAVDAVRDALADFRGPVVMGLASGHTTGAMWSLPLGVPVRLSTSPRPRLEGEETAVA
jgi:muramoyltetrapeptide carboxypeptidase